MTDDLSPLESLDVAAIKEFLLDIAVEGASHRIDWPTVPEPCSSVQRMFSRSSRAAQSRLKAAIALAIGEWQLSACGYESLVRLAYMAGLTKASAAIPALRAVTTLQALQQSHDGTFRAWEHIVAAAGGMPTTDEVVELLESWYYDPQVDARLCGQLFLALCRSRPQAFVQYAPRFFELRRFVPGYHDDESLLDQFVIRVPPNVLLRHFEELSSSDRQQLWQWLSLAEYGPYDFDPVVLTVRSRQAPGLVARLCDTQRPDVNLLSVTISSMWQRFGEGDLNEKLATALPSRTN